MNGGYNDKFLGNGFHAEEISYWDLPSSAMLRCAHCTDVSGQPIGPKGQIVSPETSVTINLRCVTSEKSENLIYNAAEGWNHQDCLFSPPSRLDNWLPTALFLTVNSPWRECDVHVPVPSSALVTLCLGWLSMETFNCTSLLSFIFSIPHTLIPFTSTTLYL